MNVEEIMSWDPFCCTIDTSLKDAARMMLDHDCGEIPVADNLQDLRPVGVITDRDITCRTVAHGKDPLQMIVRDCMTNRCLPVGPDTSIEECCRVLEENKIRRIPIADGQGKCCGIVAQADLARHLPTEKVAQVVRDVSQSPAGKLI